MISITSMKIRLPVLLLLVVVIAWVFVGFPTSNDKAVAILGLVLFLEAYFLGIDSSIVHRIVKMKPLSRVINGLYYVAIGAMALITMAFGQHVIYQWAFGVFLCILGVSILFYQTKKGPKVAFVKGEQVTAVAVKPETKGTKKGSDSKPIASQAKSFKITVKKYELYTYFVSLGSDLSVTAFFFALFMMMDFVTAFLLFILGYLVRLFGDRIAKNVGVRKEQALPEEVSFK
jgi:hypothetical protein